MKQRTLIQFRSSIARNTGLFFLLGLIALSTIPGVSSIFFSHPVLAQTTPDTSTEAQAMEILERAEKQLQSLQSLQAD